MKKLSFLLVATITTFILIDRSAARDYNAATGRYIEVDPIGLAGGINPLNYAANNPLNFIDPLGLMCLMGQDTGRVVCWNDITRNIYADDNTGYSGTGIGRNNPDAQALPFIGATPRGDWIVGFPQDRPESTGPISLPLMPVLGKNTVFFTNRGPDTFWMHGDNEDHDASEGCPILSRNTRKSIPPGELFRVVRTILPGDIPRPMPFWFTPRR